MPFAFTLDSPVPTDAYLAVNAKARAHFGGEAPDGLIAHLGFRAGDVLRHVDVWESADAWHAFQSVLAPLIAEAVTASSGELEPGAATFTPIEVIDTWLGDRDAPAGAHAFVEQVPANEEIYGKIRAQLPGATPDGLIAHVVQKIDGGLRYFDVWQTYDLWMKFKHTTLVPVVTDVLAGYGIPHTDEGVTWETIDIVDTWIGAQR